MDASLTQSHWSLLEDAPTPGHRPLMLHFLLHNGPHCQVETCSLRAFITTVTYRLAVRDAGFPGATGFLLQCQYTSSKHLCTLHTGVASWRALSMFTFKAARKVYRMVPVAVLAPCAADGNSPPGTPLQCCPVNCPPLRGLPLEPTPSGSQPHSTTCYEMATVSPIRWSLRLFSLLGIPPPLLMWSLRLLSLLGILPTTPVVLLFILFLTPVVLLFTLSSLFAEPRVGKA